MYNIQKNIWISNTKQKTNVQALIRRLGHVPTMQVNTSVEIGRFVKIRGNPHGFWFDVDFASAMVINDKGLCPWNPYKTMNRGNPGSW